MQLRSCHVTLLRGNCEPPKFFPNQTFSAERTHVVLCLKFLITSFDTVVPGGLKFASVYSFFSP